MTDTLDGGNAHVFNLSLERQATWILFAESLEDQLPDVSSDRRNRCFRLETNALENQWYEDGPPIVS